MTGFTLSDLAALGTPGIIEGLDYEAILAARKADFTGKMSDFGLDYDVVDLETDPGVVLLEESAYREVILRARGNAIARARYLYFARGAEIDHLGAFYDAVRMSGESDERFLTRIILAVQGRSTAGTAPRYRAVALASSINVEDAVVYVDGRDPTVHVAVFAADNNGVASDGLLATVRAAVTDPAVRMVNDVIDVRSAVVLVVNITAHLKLQPNTSDTLLTALSAALPGQWSADSGLGRDLTHDWLVSRLMVAGVYGVEIAAPASDVVVPPYQAVRIGTVTLDLAGRAF